MKYEIWMEGYVATGESQTAQKIGEYEAQSFDEAIEIYEKVHSIEKGEEFKVDRYTGTQAKRSKYGIWACRLFDNEIDARKSFG